MADAVTSGNWIKSAELGSGSFGVVSLWKNFTTGDCIAVKMCKWTLKTSLSQKHKERWKNEVEMMAKFNSPYIVNFKALPEDLAAIISKINSSTLPVLSMEYCSKGNLRQVLRQADNCCGLMENEVKCVLSDISKAILYLHNFNIIHRDIKPENITMQECDTRKNGIIYKLIDLGYAKELKDPCVSFVGTLHYLAPEIITQGSYDYSVDLWSFGILTFEIICGRLPFLPNMSNIFERFKHIKDKGERDICITQTDSGQIEYSSHLTNYTQVSFCMKNDLENWLQHILQFDPKKRSELFHNGQDSFQKLNEILNKKIINVFVIFEYRFYSYEIGDTCSVLNILKNISSETGVDIEKMILLTNAGKRLQLDFLPQHHLIEDMWAIVFSKNCPSDKFDFHIPEAVKIMFDKCELELSWRYIKPIFSHSLHYIRQELMTFETLHHSFTMCCDNLNFMKQKLEQGKITIRNNVQNTLTSVQNYIAIFKKSQSRFYNNLNDIMAYISRCQHSVSALMQKIHMMLGRITLLQDVSVELGKLLEGSDLQNIYHLAVQNYQTTSGEKRGDMRNMCRLVSDTIRHKAMLNNSTLQMYFRNFAVLIENAENIFEWINRYIGILKSLHGNLRIGSEALENKSFCDPESVLSVGALMEENFKIRRKFEEIKFPSWNYEDFDLEESLSQHCAK